MGIPHYLIESIDTNIMSTEEIWNHISILEYTNITSILDNIHPYKLPIAINLEPNLLTNHILPLYNMSNSNSYNNNIYTNTNNTTTNINVLNKDVRIQIAYELNQDFLQTSFAKSARFVYYHNGNLYIFYLSE